MNIEINPSEKGYYIIDGIPGMHIETAIKESIAFCSTTNNKATLTFNGVKLLIEPDSKEDELIEVFDFINALRRKKYFESEEYAKFQKEQAIRSKQKQNAIAEMEEKAKSHVPLFTDKSAWRVTAAKNREGYGKAVMDYAWDTARYFEAMLPNWGGRLSTLFKACETVADYKYGVTGFQHGCAMQMLRQWWAYGKLVVPSTNK